MIVPLTQKEDTTYGWSEKAVHGQQIRYGAGPFRSLGWVDNEPGKMKRVLQLDPDTILCIGAEYLTKTL